MDDFLKGIPLDELKAMRVKYANNTSATTLLDGAIAIKEKELAEERAKKAREEALAKVVKALEGKWTDDLTNILVTREEVDDMAHGEEVEVVREGEKVKEERYPKVKALVVRTNVYWSQSNPATTAGASAKGKKANEGSQAIVVKFLRGDKMELVGEYSNGTEGVTDIRDNRHKTYYPATPYITCDTDSQPRNIARNGYYVYDKQGKLKYAPKG